MEDTPETLRRRIALYQHYLADGVREPMATQFRELIAIAGAELETLERNSEGIDARFTHVDETELKWQPR